MTKRCIKLRSVVSCDNALCSLRTLMSFWAEYMSQQLLWIRVLLFLLVTPNISDQESMSSNDSPHANKTDADSRTATSPLQALFGKHIEATVLASLQKYMNHDQLVPIIRKALGNANCEAEAHWKTCVDFQWLKPQFILPYIKLGLIQGEMQSCMGGSYETFINAASVCESAKTAYQLRDTDAEVRAGGQALVRCLDLHNRDLNFAIGYILARIYLLPHLQRNILVESIKVASQHPRNMQMAAQGIPAEYPTPCREKMKTYRFLLNVLKSVCGLRYMTQVTQECHMKKREIVHGFAPSLQCQSCPPMMTSVSM